MTTNFVFDFEAFIKVAPRVEVFRDIREQKKQILYQFRSKFQSDLVLVESEIYNLFSSITEPFKMFYDTAKDLHTVGFGIFVIGKKRFDLVDTRKKNFQKLKLRPYQYLLKEYRFLLLRYVGKLFLNSIMKIATTIKILLAKGVFFLYSLLLAYKTIPAKLKSISLTTMSFIYKFFLTFALAERFARNFTNDQTTNFDELSTDIKTADSYYNELVEEHISGATSRQAERLIEGTSLSDSYRDLLQESNIEYLQKEVDAREQLQQSSTQHQIVEQDVWSMQAVISEDYFENAVALANSITTSLSAEDGASIFERVNTWRLAIQDFMDGIRNIWNQIYNIAQDTVKPFRDLLNDITAKSKEQSDEGSTYIAKLRAVVSAFDAVLPSSTKPRKFFDILVYKQAIESKKRELQAQRIPIMEDYWGEEAGELNRFVNAPMGSKTESPNIPGYQLGGFVNRTGMAVIHGGEQIAHQKYRRLRNLVVNLEGTLNMNTMDEEEKQKLGALLINEIEEKLRNKWS